MYFYFTRFILFQFPKALRERTWLPSEILIHSWGFRRRIGKDKSILLSYNICIVSLKKRGIVVFNIDVEGAIVHDESCRDLK